MSKPSHPWLMLIGRSLLFISFQGLIALVFLLRASPTAWYDSSAWWMVSVALADIVGLVLLIRLYRLEGLRFKEVFKVQRPFMRQDLLFMLGFLLIGGGLGFLPNILTARWLFGDPGIALAMLVRPLPAWAAIIGAISFPLLQGIVEIPTYMLYVLPRLERQGLRPWLALALTSAFLSAQHIFAPFLPDARFITYRLLMFLPFAILLSIVMRWRPRLMPYMLVMHVLMDMSIAVMSLFVMT